MTTSNDTQPDAGSGPELARATGSDSYDPLVELKREVDRFKATNQFTPMLVTGFYMQAACVVTELTDARERIKTLEQIVKSKNSTINRLEKQIDAYEDQWVDDNV